MVGIPEGSKEGATHVFPDLMTVHMNHLEQLRKGSQEKTDKSFDVLVLPEYR